MCYNYHISYAVLSFISLFTNKQGMEELGPQDGRWTLQGQGKWIPMTSCLLGSISMSPHSYIVFPLPFRSISVKLLILDFLLSETEHENGPSIFMFPTQGRTPPPTSLMGVTSYHHIWHPSARDLIPGPRDRRWTLKHQTKLIPIAEDLLGSSAPRGHYK